MSPRPGFVLEVDRSTPATLFWHGEGFRLEKPPGRQPGRLPSRTARTAQGPRRGDPSRPRATRSATRPPLVAAAAGNAAHDRLRRHLAPVAADAHPDIRQRVIEAVLDTAAAAGVDDVVLIAALALHRRMTDDELRHALGRGSSTPSPLTGSSCSTMPRTRRISSISG